MMFTGIGPKDKVLGVLLFKKQRTQKIMSYKISLLSANIPETFDANLEVGLNYDEKQVATVDLSWTKEHFSATFNGFGPEMPEPGHPVSFIKGVVDAINTTRVSPEEPIESVFSRMGENFSITV